MIKTFFKGLLAVVLTIIALMVMYFITLSLIYGVNKISCPKFGEQIEQPTKYEFWTGTCYIQLDNGNWIDSYGYKGVVIDY